MTSHSFWRTFPRTAAFGYVCAIFGLSEMYHRSQLVLQDEDLGYEYARAIGRLDVVDEAMDNLKPQLDVIADYLKDDRRLTKVLQSTINNIDTYNRQERPEPEVLE